MLATWSLLPLLIAPGTLNRSSDTFVVPQLRAKSVELQLVIPGEQPSIIWSRTHRLYPKDSDDAIWGSQWQKANLCLTVSPDGRSLFIPHVTYRAGTLSVGGDVLDNSGERRTLTPVMHKRILENGEVQQLYVGWDGASPAHVVQRRAEQVQSYTWSAGAVKKASNIPPSLARLDAPAEFGGAKVPSDILHSDRWLATYTFRWLSSFDESVIMGSRGTAVIAASQSWLTMIYDGQVKSRSNSAHAEFLLPVDRWRFVGRVVTSNKPRPEFDRFWADPIDPYISSEVFLFDLRHGSRVKLAPGLLALPVPAKWRSLASKNIRKD